MLVKNIFNSKVSKIRYFNSRIKQNLQDWQYTHHINKSLKLGEIDQAFNLVVRSHLKNTILDIQTFNNFFKLIQTRNYDISYHEMLYKIYRENFKPHKLIIQWMNRLVDSQDPKIQNILLTDFEYLGLKYPIKKKYQKKQQINVINKALNQQRETEDNKNSKGNIEQLENKFFPKSSTIQFQQDQSYILQGCKIQPEEIKNIIQSIFGSYGKIKLHNIKIQSKSIQNQESKQTNKNNQKQNYYNPDQEVPVSNISIGMIQISRRKSDKIQKPQKPDQ